MEWNLSKTDQQMIASRTNYKYEDEYTFLYTAIDAARLRSTKSLATIYVHKHPGGYQVNAHGVLRQKYTEVCRFKNGMEI